MIALLSYSINSLANEGDTIPSTGRQDSVLIAYDDLRKVNSKLIVNSKTKVNMEILYNRNIAGVVGIGAIILLIISIL